FHAGRFPLDLFRLDVLEFFEAARHHRDHPRRLLFARGDQNQVASQTGKFILNVGLRALAKRHEQDDRHHTDDDAQHREEGPDFVLQDRIQGDQDAFKRAHWGNMSTTVTDTPSTSSRRPTDVISSSPSANPSTISTVCQFPIPWVTGRCRAMPSSMTKAKA